MTKSATDRAKAEARKRARHAVAMAAVRAGDRPHLFGEDGKNGFPRAEMIEEMNKIVRRIEREK